MVRVSSKQFTSLSVLLNAKSSRSKKYRNVEFTLCIHYNSKKNQLKLWCLVSFMTGLLMYVIVFEIVSRYSSCS